MGAYQDLVQGTVVLAGAVVSTLRNGAFDALVSMTVHNAFPPFIWDKLSMP